MSKKISHWSALLFLVICSVAQADGKAYRCKTPDGKTLIQNMPCDSKKPDKETPAKPDYPEIVKCSLIDSIERISKK